MKVHATTFASFTVHVVTAGYEDDRQIDQQTADFDALSVARQTRAFVQDLIASRDSLKHCAVVVVEESN